jgi:hypothetical protein
VASASFCPYGQHTGPEFCEIRGCSGGGYKGNLSSGMRLRAAWYFTDVSEETAASIFRVERGITVFRNFRKLPEYTASHLRKQLYSGDRVLCFWGICTFFNNNNNNDLTMPLVISLCRNSEKECSERTRRRGVEREITLAMVRSILLLLLLLIIIILHM